MIELSIIVPCYNVKEYLNACMEKLTKVQSFINCQIICINDGSTDCTLSILESYKEKLYNYSIINQGNNGLSGARNKGLEVATGDWVFFVDSDDLISVDGLIRTYKRMKSSDADICCCEYYDYIDNKISKKDEQIPSIDSITGVDFLNKYYFKSVLSMVWRYLYKRDFLINNNLSFAPGVYFEDMDFTPKALVKAKKIMYLKDSIYYYRQRNDSIMNSSFSTKKFNDSIYVATENLNLILEKNLIKKTMVKSARYIVLRAISLYQQPFININYQSYTKLIDTTKIVKNKSLLAILLAYQSHPIFINRLLALVKRLKHS